MTIAIDKAQDTSEARRVVNPATAAKAADRRVDRDNRETVGTQFVDNPR
ncbi:MAG: hypothetical protein GX835_13830, partial [Desulfobulbaceae bacterium]|nr:hypothetical protein [Desulfobulbaceae bacterium]